VYSGYQSKTIVDVTRTRESNASDPPSVTPGTRSVSPPYAYVIRRHAPYSLQFAAHVWHTLWHGRRSVGLGKGSLGRTKGVHGGLGWLVHVYQGLRFLHQNTTLVVDPPDIGVAKYQSPHGGCMIALGDAQCLRDWRLGLEPMLGGLVIGGNVSLGTLSLPLCQCSLRIYRKP
jgi:hypothetical protein